MDIVMAKTETWGSPVDFKGCSYGPGRRRFITLCPIDDSLPFDRRGFFGLDMRPEVTTEQAQELLNMLERYVEEFTYCGPMVEGAPVGRSALADASTPLDELVRARQSDER